MFANISPRNTNVIVSHISIELDLECLTSTVKHLLKTLPIYSLK